MTRDRALSALRLSRHQYYYKPKSTRVGKKPTQTTMQMLQGSLVEQADEEVVGQIEQVHKDPDTNYGYRRMCAALMILGYFINHKKVYRYRHIYQICAPLASRFLDEISPNQTSLGTGHYKPSSAS